MASYLNNLFRRNRELTGLDVDVHCAGLTYSSDVGISQDERHAPIKFFRHDQRRGVGSQQIADLIRHKPPYQPLGGLSRIVELS